jgi:hypothetical protein
VESTKKIQLVVALACAVVLTALIAAALLRPSVQTDSSSTPAATQDAKNNEASKDKEQPQDIPSIDGSTDEKNTSDDSKSAESNGTESYAYAAAAGDTYTRFAREAINSYTASQNIALTPAAALQAEVDLANAAGSPELEIGQKVTIATNELADVLGQETSSTQSSAAPTDKSDADAAVEYTYTASAGDSYTGFARQAVDTYVVSQKLNLTPAQRVAAETYLTARANSPYLEIGQSVTIAADDVKSATDQAANLSSDQQAAWQRYVSTAGL